MDIYHVWCNLRPGLRDRHFDQTMARCMNHLHAEGLVESWRLTRRTLGLGAQEAGDWHLTLEVRDLRRLEGTFQRMASSCDDEEEEGPNQAINALVTNARFSLTRNPANSVC